jgi:hypothetical protein
MDATTAFDRALEKRLTSRAYPVINAATRRDPNQVRDALLFVVDTLDTCRLGASEIFGIKARPEHAFAILDRTLALLEKMPNESEQFATRSAFDVEVGKLQAEISKAAERESSKGVCLPQTKSKQISGRPQLKIEHPNRIDYHAFESPKDN